MDYFVDNNTQENGDHEVHRMVCSSIPDPKNRSFLGNFSNCEDAVKIAVEEYYDQCDGYYCSENYHTS